MENAEKFAELERVIRRIDIDCDTIELSYHLRKFSELFQVHIQDSQTARELFAHLNRAALEDSKFPVNMAVAFTYRPLADLEIQDTKVRNEMLTILQQNFQSIEDLKRDNVEKFYNSVTLLGEYYSRKTNANGDRIKILGKSLLLLLATELEKEIKKSEETEGYTFDSKFAKLILSQVTLNGGAAKSEHQQEVDDLNYSIRKCLINIAGLSSRSKAYLLMALDMFYTNFSMSTQYIDKLYGKYLFEPDEDTPTKQSRHPNAKEGKTENKMVSSLPKTPDAEASGSGIKSMPRKDTDKTERVKKHRSRPQSTKAIKKEEKPETVPPVAKSRSTPPKKNQPNSVPKRQPILTSPKKDQRPNRVPVQKTPPQRRTPPEKLRPLTPNVTPPRVSGNSPKSNKTPESPSVLKQNCKGQSKCPISPNANTTNTVNSVPLKQQHPVESECDVENLAWDDFTITGDSPQKMNHHTKSFLSFLAQK